MTTENDILPFCTTTGLTNLYTQAAYAAATELANGNASGIAKSALINKVLRQTSVMSSALAAAIVALTGQPVVDSDGALSTITTNLITAFQTAAADAVLPCGTATGTANALILTPTVALPAYKAGVPFSFTAASNNAAGGTQINISGLGLITLTKDNANALSANDIEANHTYFGMLTSTSNATLINKPAFAHGTDVAVASTLVLNGTAGDIVNITGSSATISAVTLNEGKFKVCKFASTGPVLNYGTSLLTNAGGASYTIQANDVVIFYGLASGVVVGLIHPANGQSPVAVTLPTYAANTVVVNNTTGTASPVGVALSASQFIGRGSSGNIAALSPDGTTVQISGTTLQVVSGGIGTTQLANAGATLAKIQNAAASSRLLGSGSSGSGSSYSELSSDGSLTIGSSTVGVTQATTGQLGGAVVASTAQQQAASSNSVMATPGNMVHHPGVAKSWSYITGSSGGGTINASMNLSSITRSSTGVYIHNLTTPMADTNFQLAPFIKITGSGNFYQICEDKTYTRTTSSFKVQTWNTNSNAIEDCVYGVAVFGNQ